MQDLQGAGGSPLIPEGAGCTMLPFAPVGTNIVDAKNALAHLVGQIRM
jgi:hypothetical protein